MPFTSLSDLRLIGTSLRNLHAFTTEKVDLIFGFTARNLRPKAAKSNTLIKTDCLKFAITE